ncbi:tyrosine-type recombinase/integrase [Bosea sp. MMO-172]|uniref:tyrosine-type recombinase/integrase n=1 Tax=Bosea sp. MMO-172 TaxID=3127885 RepID=UPI003017D0EA
MAAFGLLSDYLAQGRYRDRRHRIYIASVLHFGSWLSSCGLPLESIDEDCIGEFLSEHQSVCTCKHRMPSNVITLRPALSILLRVLRAEGVVGQPVPSAIDIEISAFETTLKDVWGLSLETCRHRCGTIRRLLIARIRADQPIANFLTPSNLRAFVMGDEYRKPRTIRCHASAVRCYLRYRALLGDDVRLLLHAVPTPSFKPPMDLPEALSTSELEELLRISSTLGRSRRRAHAIVRCLADLGMRSLEVVRLTLDDIDWENGLVRVPASKSRRRDFMPLPSVTGEALADYIVHERPPSVRREVFVRHLAPIGEPVGRRVVQRTLHTAYRRLGWERTRVHILRHTIASNLVNDAVPLKQVADVMRHRSVVTTAGYARVDSTRLSAVALPWPGESA